MNAIRELIDEDGVGRLPRSRAGLISFVLTTLGILLGATLDMAFLILAAAGIFGPGLLREFGLLRDQDELQREASQRAAKHAYLIGGLFTMIVIIALEWGSADLDDNSYSAAVLLLAFLVPYFCSYLNSFWGAQKAAQRILLAFGLFWLGFNVLGNLKDLVAMVMQCLVALPFFALAFTSRRLPRVTGVALLAVAIFAFVFFDLHVAFLSSENFGKMAVILLFWLPLAYSGLTLLPAREESSED
jgi:hypothetical protein